MEPWLASMTDTLRGHLGDSYYDYCVKRRIIEYQPLEMLRGRSYPDTAFLMDEAQQLTWEYLEAVLTRIGENSKFYLMGDPRQKDVLRSGYEKLVREASNRPGSPIAIVRFNKDESVRSETCKFLVTMFDEIYEREEQERRKPWYKKLWSYIKRTRSTCNTGQK